MQEAEKDTPKGFANDKEKRQGFEQIVRQYSEKLYWTVRRIVINHDDANDVLQNVFIKVWKSIGDFEQRASLSTWLYRIAVNESLDFLRRQKDTASIDESGAGANIANHLLADDYFDGDRAQALLQEAIATLPEVQRVVFTMRYYDDPIVRSMSKEELQKSIENTTALMKQAAKDLDFMQAAQYRDEILRLQKELEEKA